MISNDRGVIEPHDQGLARLQPAVGRCFPGVNYFPTHYLDMVCNAHEKPSRIATGLGVDANQACHTYFEPKFLADLADAGMFHRFARIDQSTRQHPVAFERFGTSFHQQDATLCIGDQRIHRENNAIKLVFHGGNVAYT